MSNRLNSTYQGTKTSCSNCCNPSRTAPPLVVDAARQLRHLSVEDVGFATAPAQ